MLQYTQYHRPNSSYSYPPGPGQNHQNFISVISLLASPAGALQREQCFCKIVNIMCFINILNKSDSNSSLPCPETFKHKTKLKRCVLKSLWHPLLETVCFTKFLSSAYCRTTGAMRRPGLLLLPLLDSIYISYIPYVDLT